MDSILPVDEVAGLIKEGAFILDVRTMLEARKGMAPQAKNIPLLRLKRQLNELPKDIMIVTYCGTGERAGKAKDILKAAGFKAVNGGAYSNHTEDRRQFRNHPQNCNCIGLRTGKRPPVQFIHGNHPGMA